MANYIIINGELYHWGVKGMKWGVRNKKELKVARKYERVGRYKGYAEDDRRKGASEAEPYYRDARLLNKQADAWEKSGEILKAEAARRRAQKLQDTGNEKKRQWDESAAEYDNIAGILKQRADRYATKKKVDLGKQLIDKIIEDTRNQTAKKFIDHENLSKELDELFNDTPKPEAKLLDLDD